MNIVMSSALGATAVRSWSDMLIMGEDGHKIETFTPMGVDDATPNNISGVTIDGISQFGGLVAEEKTLEYTAVGDLITWDGGEAVNIFEDGTYTLYDSDDNNFMLITVVYGSLPVGDQSDTITVQEGVLADAITVLQLDDELLTTAPVIKDAAGDDCTAAVDTYPRPTNVKNYAIDSTDKSLLAIKNQVSSSPVTDLSVDYSIYKIARPYTSLVALDADHKSGSEISKTAAKMFANGAGTVSVMNCYDGEFKKYALCLTELETQNYDYDIMVPTVDVDDANFVLCAAHAITYSKIIIAPKIGTASVVRASWGTLTLDEGQYGICYDSTVYSVGELAGAAAAVIAQKKPWIPCEWGPVSGINPSGYSKDDLNVIEGTSASLGGSTITQIGTSTVLLNGRGLKAGSWIDDARTKQYLRYAVLDAWVTAKLMIAASGQKIPYTAAGIVAVKNILCKPLKKAQRDGALRQTSYAVDGTEMPGFVVGMPNIEDIPLSYKVARQLPDVTITAYLSGAMSTINPLHFTISLGEV